MIRPEQAQTTGAVWLTITEQGDGLSYETFVGEVVTLSAGDHIPVKWGYAGTLVNDGLAVLFTGKVEVEPESEPEPQAESLDDLELRPHQVDVLNELGYDTVAKLQRTTDDELLAIPGFGPATVKAIREKVSDA
jgi:hypothetical protein